MYSESFLWVMFVIWWYLQFILPCLWVVSFLYVVFTVHFTLSLDGIFFLRDVYSSFYLVFVWFLFFRLCLQFILPYHWMVSFFYVVFTVHFTLSLGGIFSLGGVYSSFYLVFGWYLFFKWCLQFILPCLCVVSFL